MTDSKITAFITQSRHLDALTRDVDRAVEMHEMIRLRGEIDEAFAEWRRQLYALGPVAAVEPETVDG